MLFRTALIFLIAPCLAALAGTPPPGTINIPDLVERVDKGVVNIQAVTLIRERFADPIAEQFFFQFYGVPRERVRKQPSLGSGFVIDDNGFILTNNHVVERASEVEIFFNDGKRTSLKAKIIGTDKKSDIALLQVKPGSHLQPMDLGNSDLVKVGESVIAIGNPFGLSHTVTAGIISAKNRVIGQGPFDNFLQTDASINPGNSGGPLFNSKGEVIGINTAINAAGQGLGFAIPINQAKKMLADLKKHGRILRGWLGTLLVTTPAGVYIDGIVLKSAAFQAGLKSGDKVVEIEGQKVEDRMDIERALEEKRAGEEISLVVERDGRLTKRVQTYRIKLGEEPKGTEIPPGLL
jgi:serine protease Do